MVQVQSAGTVRIFNYEKGTAEVRCRKCKTEWCPVLNGKDLPEDYRHCPSGCSEPYPQVKNLKREKR